MIFIHPPAASIRCARRPALLNLPRPAAGQIVDGVDAELARQERLFVLLPEDTPAITVEWRGLIAHHQVVDLDVFDARLAATAIVHKLDYILTFDTGFARYAEIEVAHPATVASLSAHPRG